MYLKESRFSLWCDFIEKSFLEDGFLKLIKEAKVNGATSNPAIFKNSILTSSAYKEQKTQHEGKSPKEIYEELAISDIRRAGEILLDMYKQGDDGFISIEVDPLLSNDSQGTIEEGRRLYKAIGLPNVMIKIPATASGYEAMRVLMSEGININATLIFSPEQALKCAEAFKSGVGHANNPQGVISVFVSRFDTKVNLKDENGLTLGIINAIDIYRQIEAKSLPHVRVLFASTGAKDASLKKDFYIEKLLFPNTINTAPLDALEYFLTQEQRSVQEVLDKSKIDEYFEMLEKNGIDKEAVYQTLLSEGLEAFEVAFREILKAL